MSDHPLPRRDFVRGVAAATFGAMIVPRRVLGGVGYQAPSDTMNVAIVGVGGMGFSNMSQLLSENVVAVCDVDFSYVERSLANRLRGRNGQPPSETNVRLGEAYRKAEKFTDFRRMLERRTDIDGIVVATPDHLHAVIAAAAMRAGKHVYVQKPLTYSVHEARALARIAAETGVTTQMGNQGHSMEGTRRINEIIAAGIIGPVREVHVWTDRPVRYWAQGIPRPVPPAPAATPASAPEPSTPPVAPQWNMRTVENAVLRAMAENPQTPPEGMDWNLFLGPAPEIAYHPAYHPFAWRGWIDFGVGALGDMGAHLLDQAYWSLDLGLPTSVEASSTPWGGPADNPATYPLAMTAHYEFPARGERPPVKLYWYDGGLMPPRPPFIPDDQPLARGDGGGAVFIGEKGILTHETYGNNPTVYPAERAAEAAALPKSFLRVETGHEMNWVQATKGEAAISAPFSYAAPLTEVMLLGMAALRAGQGRRLLYDAAGMRFTNAPDANQYLTREYRAGWAL